jgi:NAD(P)-dependent dehydrogenase (short-subunit alcohol dehydrogenase family)
MGLILTSPAPRGRGGALGTLEHMSQHPSSLPDQTGRTFVVTGANSGLGLETARELAGAGGHVVLAVRDTDRGAEAAAAMVGSTDVRELDLADLGSVHRFAEKWDGPLDVLVNNAGIMMVAEGRTADGFERQFGTNHLGHFALTNLLLPQVTDRVVTVSSLLHRGPQVDFDDYNGERRYHPHRAYQQSKLSNLLFTAELQRRLDAAGSRVRANAAHPGYSATNLQSHHAVPLMNVLMAVGNKVFATTAAQGARPTIQAAIADLPGNTFVGPTQLRQQRGAPGPVPRSLEAQDPDAARRLWDLSEELTGVRFPL